jgi:AraC family transcriptional regulator, transcriptional activator of pobA
MKKEEHKLEHYESLAGVHRLLGLPGPIHPLISLLNNMEGKINMDRLKAPFPHVLSFYKMSYSVSFDGRLKYGQNSYDFDNWGLLFAAPGQLIGCSEDYDLSAHRGYTVLIHPDFFWNYPLAKKIRQYGFFSYSANEALHLSDQERATIVAIFKLIEEEITGRLDDFSQDVIITQIELLLNCSNRFYKRQFITRKPLNNDMLMKLDEFLENYFNTALHQGIPTVQHLSDHLNISPSYLSDMLRSLTGQNAQQHIHNKLIEKAKEKLSATNLSISEVAYELGFEHPQSFNRLFKKKTQLSPLEFRKTFN